MNDIVLNFDEKISEYPGEMTGFMMMFLSLFFYGMGITCVIIMGIENITTIMILSSAVILQIMIPFGGVCEICCSGNGSMNEGARNAIKGAGAVCWCCCFNDC